VSSRSYSLFAGIALLCAGVVFFALPQILDYDAFLPFLFALLSFLSGIAVLFMGLGSER
jgi:hypothetical protein